MMRTRARSCSARTPPAAGSDVGASRRGRRRVVRVRVVRAVAAENERSLTRRERGEARATSYC